MASGATGGSQLSAFCAVASFLWLGHSIESHQLIEQPRVSSILVLLTAGAFSYAASHFWQWLPGSNGRFDDEGGSLRPASTSLPKRPRRYFLPVLIAAIIFRLELFHRVTADLQCSSPGVEAFLPLVILFYELLPGRRARVGSSTKDSEDENDLGRTTFDDVADWVAESKQSLTISTLLISLGACLASSQDMRSTYICTSFDNTTLVRSLQWLGLLLDGVIVILLWRVLAWARTNKSRLMSLSVVFLASAVGSGFLYSSLRMFLPSVPLSHHFKGIDALYVFDVVTDGFAVAVLFVSASLLTTEKTPLSLVGIFTFISGLVVGWGKLKLTGGAENTMHGVAYLAVVLICLGTSIFVYANNIQRVVLIHRTILVAFMFISIIAATIVAISNNRNDYLFEHPIETMIFKARTNADRYLTHAASSKSLPVAVNEYKARYGGRDPPPKFDEWYKFAVDHKSPIIDDFDQVVHDIRPFWGISPSKIRDDIQRVAKQPGIALLKVANGTASHSLSRDSENAMVMDELVKMVNKFAQHLPDMDLPINLDDRPRVLTPWEDVRRFTEKAKEKGFGSKLLTKREDETDQEEAPSQPLDIQQPSSISVRKYQELTALTCPPGTATRAGIHWDVRDFCLSCVRPHSRGSGIFLNDFAVSQSICHQSDLFHLHSFFFTAPAVPPLRDLVPVFSRSKTSSYSDILIPLPTLDEVLKKANTQPDTSDFDMKTPALYWRGAQAEQVDGEMLHGGQQERLVHLVSVNSSSSSSSSSSETLMLIPQNEVRSRAAYERVPTSLLNFLLPFDIGFSSVTPSASHPSEFTTTTTLPPSSNPLQNQYILILDPPFSSSLPSSSSSLSAGSSQSSPSNNHPTFLATLRSTNLPFSSTLFSQWYTPRLQPYLHFIPVDIRFHALHSTLAYFTGLKGKASAADRLGNTRGAMVNGREVRLKARAEEAKWIVEQGAKWAGKALRKEDEEVYLFRVLVEWGRVIQDGRDDMGYVGESRKEAKKMEG
ncbi:glycosyltransferase family 90 protein [Copromyces sp. CBS 386.78]|nr:glycosyltransferase family 90 protein [Copromyces sp. CBS 386.78]